MTGPNVLRILDGSKTQTRRITKYQAGGRIDRHGTTAIPINPNYSNEINSALRRGVQVCPFGCPGDEVWVRETFAYTDHSINIKPGWVYRATDPEWGTEGGLKWKPSIFMPRAASRITLKLKAVRIERLQDISEEDAIAEGIKREWWNDQGETPGSTFYLGYATAPGVGHLTAKAAFRELWESINGHGSWDLNPWVWVLAFERKTEL
jgi:hypothetical protein